MTTENQPDDMRILDAGALKALAHPMRVEIFDVLSQVGPQTASSLAERLGESSGATSYHLRALAKHELIREVPGRGSARERWWERPQGAISMNNPDLVKTPSGRAVTEAVVGEFYRRRNEQLMEYLRRSMRNGGGNDEAMFTAATARLTGPQFEKLMSDVQALFDEAVVTHREQEGPGVRTYSLRADMFPMDVIEAPEEEP